MATYVFEIMFAALVADCCTSAATVAEVVNGRPGRGGPWCRLSGVTDDALVRDTTGLLVLDVEDRTVSCDVAGIDVTTLLTALVTPALVTSLVVIYLSIITELFAF